jgi:hypothetical protein
MRSKELGVGVALLSIISQRSRPLLHGLHSLGGFPPICLELSLAYTRSRNLEDSGYKRLADLFRGFLKRGPAQATNPPNDQPVRQQRGR